MRLPSAGSIALNAVSATTTSNTIPLDGYENICIQVTASGISSGNGVFTVLGSNDGVNFAALSTLIDSGSTNLTTSVASKTLSSNITAFLHVPYPPDFIQVKVTFTTDGAYTAIVTGDKR